MKSFRAARGSVTVRGPIVFASLLCGLFFCCATSPTIMAQASKQPEPAPAAQNASPSQETTQPSAAEAAHRKAWRKSMVRLRLPKKGCFTASYPSTEWKEVPCSIRPAHPQAPRRGGEKGSGPSYVGGGNNGSDFSAVVPCCISSAEGSFPYVTPGITETGTDPGPNPPQTEVPGVSNVFTVQLNSNYFNPPACSKATVTNPPCQGWQQFVVENDPNNGGSFDAYMYIQYWLYNYGPNCPTSPVSEVTWKTGMQKNSCFAQVNGPDFKTLTLGDLANLTLTGKTESGTIAVGSDALFVSTPTSGGNCAIRSAPSGDLCAVGFDSLLNLAQYWNSVEFNVFGDADGTEAEFSHTFKIWGRPTRLGGPDTTIVVRTSVLTDHPLSPLPACVNESFPLETNNLNLVPLGAPLCCVYGAQLLLEWPAIEFVETTATNVTSSCGFTGIEHKVVEPVPVGSTTIGLTDDPEPSQDGERVIFTAFVAPNGSAAPRTPSGNVQFAVDGSNVGEPVKVDATGRATWGTSRLKVGTHPVTARYVPSADTLFLPSTSLEKLHTIRP